MRRPWTIIAFAAIIIATAAITATPALAKITTLKFSKTPARTLSFSTVESTPTATTTSTSTASTSLLASATISVAGTGAAAIDAAFAKASSGDTVHFGAGTFTHGILNVPSGVNVTGAGIGSTHLKFGITFGSSSRIGGTAAQGLLVGSTGVALRNRAGARNTTFGFVRFRGGGPRPGVNYSAYTNSSSGYESYDPVVQLGGKGTQRSASRITFNDCEFERSIGSYVSTHVRANIMSMWEDNRAGYAHLEYLTFNRCHWGVKNAAGQYGALSANIELKTNSYGNGSFDHNWHDVVLRDCIVERSGDFSLDFTDAARSWLRSQGLSESGNWMRVPLRFHAGNETGRSVSVIGGQIKGAGLYSGTRWPYVFCLENPIGATLRDVRIWGGNRTNREPESASAACGPIISSALPSWSLPLAYDRLGMDTVFGNTYTPGVWGTYTSSPYDH